MRSTKRRINLEGNFYPSYFFNTLRHARRYLHVRNLHPETSPSKDQFFPLALGNPANTTAPSPFPISYIVLSRSLTLPPSTCFPNNRWIRFVSSRANFEFFKSTHVRVYTRNDNPTICRAEKGDGSCSGIKIFHAFVMARDVVKRFSVLGRVRFGLGFAYRMGVEIWEARTVESVQFFFWEGRESFVICKIQDVPDFFFLFLLFSCSFSLNFLNFFKFSRERQRGREKERESYFSSLVIFYFSPSFECVEQLFSVK